MRFKMLYQARMLETKLMMAEANTDSPLHPNELSRIRPKWFKVGYFDKNKKPIFSQINKDLEFGKDFYARNQHCYTIVPYSSKHSQVGYIVLREDVLKKNLETLKIKTIYTLIAFFIFMTIIGYFLSRLFLRPIREKIESLDKFIEDTTHELNTPISAILMTVQTIKGIEPNKLKRLHSSAKRLSHMYDTLSYSLSKKIQDSTKEKFDLDILIQERIEAMGILAESKKISIEYHGLSQIVYADKEGCKRVVDNLLSNAIKYSDPDSSISFELNEKLLKVCDGGIGISKIEQKDIFKRYQRFNKERGGFGIGLSIVFEICKIHNVSINIDSEKGKGACFIIDITPIKYINNTHKQDTI